MAFAKEIGIPTYLRECREIASVTEMAYLYGNALENEEDLEKFHYDVGQTETHVWVLYFAIYYSPWKDSWVRGEDKVFGAYAAFIRKRIQDGAKKNLGPAPALHEILHSIVGYIGFDTWTQRLKTLRINRNSGILAEK